MTISLFNHIMSFVSKIKGLTRDPRTRTGPSRTRARTDRSLEADIPWISGSDLKSICGIQNLPFDFFLFRRLILIGWNIFWTERHATTITTATLWRSTDLRRGTLNNKYFFSIFEDWNWNLILNLRIVRKLNSIFKIDLWLVNQSELFFENFLNLNFFSQVTISSMDHYIII